MPPEESSKLDNIFLAYLFKSNDRKKFGNQRIFQVIINELKYLNGKSEKIYFELGLLIGDNLGQNQILGLVQNFNRNFCCRFCKVEKFWRGLVLRKK